jgi:hypothetical protein
MQELGFQSKKPKLFSSDQDINCTPFKLTLPISSRFLLQPSSKKEESFRQMVTEEGCSDFLKQSSPIKQGKRPLQTASKKKI